MLDRLSLRARRTLCAWTFLAVPIARQSLWSRNYLTRLPHLRGDYRRELREARRAIAEIGPQLSPGGQAALRRFEIRALAALGDGDAVLSRLDALRSTDDAGEALRVAASELRRHGHAAAAERLGPLAERSYLPALARDTSISPWSRSDSAICRSW